MADALFPLITVCCFWGWCPHVETGFAPAAVHDQMAHHYRTDHQADIAALTGPRDGNPTRHAVTGRRCPGCPHAFHRDGCRGKAQSGCVPLDGGGMACYRGQRPPCPCPYGACHQCGAVIVGATPPGEAFEVDFDRPPPAAVPDGTWAVRRLADTTLTCRPLADGEQPGPGEWKAREHVHQLTQEAAHA